jgi:hypothetical protein
MDYFTAGNGYLLPEVLFPSPAHALPLLVGDQLVSRLYYEHQFGPNSRPVSCRLVPCDFSERSDQSINERVNSVRGQVTGGQGPHEV